MSISSWFKSLFSQVKSLVKKLWKLALPFLQEALSVSAAVIWSSARDVLLAAAEYAAKEGLTSDAKREAFKGYMAEKLAQEWTELKEAEQNILLEMAVAIYKKAKS